MKTYGYRIEAPRRPRAVARAEARVIETPAWLSWLIGTMLGASLFAVAAASVAHAQTLAATGVRSPSTTDYVQQSVLQDMFAIDAGRLVLRRSHDPAIRAFAQQMIADHARSSEQLRQALKTGDVHATVPQSLTARDRQAITDLQTESAEQFDAAYLRSQLLPARDALDRHRAYAKAGENAALKRFAHQARPTAERHLVRLEILAQESFADRMCRASTALTEPGAA